MATERNSTLARARAAHPHRFNTEAPPKILDLPEAAWIKPPDEGHLTSGLTPAGLNHLDKFRLRTWATRSPHVPQRRES